VLVRGKSLFFNFGDLWQSWQCWQFSVTPPPPPGFDPIRPQPTRFDPMLRESAEGRNPKTPKPGFRRVILILDLPNTKYYVLITAPNKIRT